MDSFLAWNIRGLNEPAKQFSVKQLLFKSKIVLAGILETRVKEKKKQKRKYLTVLVLGVVLTIIPMPIIGEYGYCLTVGRYLLNALLWVINISIMRSCGYLLVFLVLLL